MPTFFFKFQLIKYNLTYIINRHLGKYLLFLQKLMIVLILVNLLCFNCVKYFFFKLSTFNNHTLNPNLKSLFENSSPLVLRLVVSTALQTFKLFKLNVI